MTCAHCGQPIRECQIGMLAVPGQPCYYHPGNGWHRCDGVPEDEATEPGTVAEPQVVNPAVTAAATVACATQRGATPAYTESLPEGHGYNHIDRSGHATLAAWGVGADTCILCTAHIPTGVA